MEVERLPDDKSVGGRHYLNPISRDEEVPTIVLLSASLNGPCSCPFMGLVLKVNRSSNTN